MTQEDENGNFNEDLIKKYPRSNRRLPLDIRTYGISRENEEVTTQTVHISPYGVQFRSPNHYEEGTLLKIQVSIPDYWARKQRLVDYGRVDTPDQFKILCKVVKSEDIGKRGKRKMVLARTVNMDNVDEEVLKVFLKDG